MDLIDIILKYQNNPPREDRLIALDNKLKEVKEFIQRNQSYLDNIDEPFYIYIKKYDGGYDEEEEYDPDETEPFIIINYKENHDEGYHTDHYNMDDQDFIYRIPGITEVSEGTFCMSNIYKKEVDESNFLHAIFAETYEYTDEEQLDFLCQIVYELQKTGKFKPEIDPFDRFISFESCVDIVIGDFLDDVRSTNINITGYTSNNIINIIKEAFEEHRIHYALHAQEYAEEELEIFISSIYSGNDLDNANVTIECNHCNTVIFDLNSLIE